jgi:3-methyl-2-oxobutanoate hydroxymethyltransferase
MGHIGLTPQSVHQLGGYYTHGKTSQRAQELKAEAQRLQEAGCFAVVLECVTAELAQEITQLLDIPTIGIGSGYDTDGQVLVTNDLLKLGPDQPPKFVTPIANLFETKKLCLEKYLKDQKA